MPSLLHDIHQQPSFPKEDLSEYNAGILELAVANSQIRQQYYRDALRATSEYHLADSIFDMYTQRREMAEDSRIGLKLGATTMVVTSRLVNPDAQFARNTQASAALSQLLRFKIGDLTEYLDSVGRGFGDDFHNTAEVVRSVARQEGLSRGAISAAIAGTAVVQSMCAYALVSHKPLAR